MLERRKNLAEDEISSPRLAESSGMEIIMRVVIQENYDKMSKWAADYIAAKIKEHKEERPLVLGLATGSSPIGVYNELVKKYEAEADRLAKQLNRSSQSKKRKKPGTDEHVHPYKKDNDPGTSESAQP